MVKNFTAAEKKHFSVSYYSFLFPKPHSIHAIIIVSFKIELRKPNVGSRV